MRAPRLLGDLASAFTMPTVLKLTAGSQPNSCYSPFCLRDSRRSSSKFNLLSTNKTICFSSSSRSQTEEDSTVPASYNKVSSVKKTPLKIKTSVTTRENPISWNLELNQTD